MTVADGAGEDFAGAGGVAVDQHHQGHTPRADGVTSVGVILAGIAPAGGHDRPVVDEFVRELDSSVQESAGIAAKVDDHALHPFAMQLPESGVDVAGSRLLKAV